MSPGDERRYSDEEVAVVLHRAVQPRPESRTPAGTADGLTLAELEQAAAEAGIDPARIREAALALGSQPDEPAGNVLLGPGTTHIYDRIVEGELSAEGMSELVATIRRLTRVKGSVTKIGDWLEWTSDAKTISVLVRPDSGRTRLQVLGDAGHKAVLIYGPIGIATLITLVGLGNAQGLSVGLGLGIGAGAFAAARMLWGRIGSRAGRKYRRLLDGLTAEVHRLAKRSPDHTLPPSERER